MEDENILIGTSNVNRRQCCVDKLIRLLLLKCYDIKMVKSPGGPYYRCSFMRLTNKKKSYILMEKCFDPLQMAVVCLEISMINKVKVGLLSSKTNDQRFVINSK